MSVYLKWDDSKMGALFDEYLAHGPPYYEDGCNVCRLFHALKSETFFAVHVDLAPDGDSAYDGGARHEDTDES
ncbi:MAG: hypothetical protein ACYTBJ_02245 [Planctomycetota bacterium]